MSGHGTARGRVAYVTGAASGIGAACAQRLWTRVSWPASTSKIGRGQPLAGFWSSMSATRRPSPGRGRSCFEGQGTIWSTPPGCRAASVTTWRRTSGTASSTSASTCPRSPRRARSARARGRWSTTAQRRGPRGPPPSRLAPPGRWSSLTRNMAIDHGPARSGQLPLPGLPSRRP
jgi:hypothetical protein